MRYAVTVDVQHIAPRRVHNDLHIDRHKASKIAGGGDGLQIDVGVRDKVFRSDNRAVQLGVGRCDLGELGDPFFAKGALQNDVLAIGMSGVVDILQFVVDLGVLGDHLSLHLIIRLAGGKPGIGGIGEIFLQRDLCTDLFIIIH